MTDPIKPETIHQDRLSRGPIRYGEKSLKGALLYSTQERVVAMGATEGDRDYSIYGVTEEEIVRRPADDGSGTDEFVRDLKGKLSAASLPFGTNQLRLDERSLIGDGPAIRIDIEDAYFDADNWACPVLGEIDLSQLTAGLTLRPTLLQSRRFDNQVVLTFVEGSPCADPDETEMLRVQLAANDEGDRAGGAELRTQATMLLDEASDGGWEKVSPLWVKTTDGFIRFDGGDNGTVPYGFSSETRALMVSDWFKNLPGGALVRLLLDHSGKKTVTVVLQAGNWKTVELSICLPAIDLMLPNLTSAPRILADVAQPPGEHHLRRGPLLHIVSGPLIERPTLIRTDKRIPGWKVTSRDGDVSLQLLGTLASKNVARYLPIDNWVRPPEAAANERHTGLSASRVLLPHLLPEQNDVERVSLAITSGGLQFNGNVFSNVDWEAACARGPLAKFAISLQSSLQNTTEERARNNEVVDLPMQPAVLRAEYRSVQQRNKEDPKLAPFESTYVFTGTLPQACEPQIAPLAYTQEMRQRGLLWKLAGAGDEVKLRRERTSEPGNPFGWWQQQRFVNTGPTMTGVEWLELNRTPGKDAWEAQEWLRLSDDSLVPFGSAARFEGDAEQPENYRSALQAITSKTLDTPKLGDEQSGLSKLSLKEIWDGKRSVFSLHLEGYNGALWSSKEASAPIINRLVIAKAPWLTLPSSTTVGAVSLSALNCLYLEMERVGKGFQVRRGMLGWQADSAFKLSALHTGLQVTEYFEHVGGALKRTVEFNGGVTSAKAGDQNWQYQVDVHFWSSVLTTQGQEPGTLRVICNHRLKHGDSEAKICALQDAVVRGNYLDLSADIAVVGVSNDAPDTRAMADSWQPWRRKLFNVALDALPTNASIVALLKIRPSQHLSFQKAPSPAASFSPWILPSWEACNREITPWFSANLRDRSAQTTWLGDLGRLRTANSGVSDATSISVKLYLLLGADTLNSLAYRAYTLIGAAPLIEGVEKEPHEGIPQWIPSPVKDVNPTLSAKVVPAAGGDAPPAATAAPTYRLWLFDPRPRTIHEWSTVELPETALKTAHDTAKKTLVRLGWTREAVLESLDPVKGTPQWEIVDSPLLNRDAALNWFGWPLGANVSLHERLPLTQQVVHSVESKPTQVGVEVLFQHDVREEQACYAQTFVPDLQPQVATGQLGKVEFRSAGMRVGVPHIARLNDNVAPVSVVAPTAARPVNWEDLGVLQLSKGSDPYRKWVTWDRRPTRLDNVRSLDAGVVELLLNDLVTKPGDVVVFEEVPDDLSFQQSDASWVPASLGVRLELKSAMSSIKVRLGSPGPWTSLRLLVEQRTGTTITASVAKSYFTEGQTTRLAGLFVNDQLQMFGRETVWFAAAEDAWIRYAGMQVQMAQEGVDQSKMHVASIDMLGSISLYAPQQ